VTIRNVLAELGVADFDAALAWYARLFGRPPDRRPMDGLAEWQLTETGGVQLFHAPDNTGSALITLSVDDLERHHADLAARDLPVGAITTGDRARFATIPDPEGNTITFAEPLATGT
jgi:predicted enzyme related to lactoylglutathione lyase